MTARILVVDDATTVRLYHGKLLADAGWCVEEAANGLEAIEKVAACAADIPFDLFVVDVNMPKMDGHAFVRELRARSGCPSVPVIMVSTEAQPRDGQAARAAGVNAYLVKPAKPADLVLTAALMLGDREAARQAARRFAAEVRA